MTYTGVVVTDKVVLIVLSERPASNFYRAWLRRGILILGCRLVTLTLTVSAFTVIGVIGAAFGWLAFLWQGYQVNVLIKQHV